jgi:hypothetical protein
MVPQELVSQELVSQELVSQELVSQGMGFECARHPPIGRSTGREVGIRRKRIGCASIVDQDHGLPPWRVNQGGPDPRSKRVSGVKPWRSTRRLSANFSQLSRREVRDPGSLISCSRRIRLPPLQPIRAGWALASPTLCKSAAHSEVVRIHPCQPSSCLPSSCLPSSCLPSSCLPSSCLPSSCLPSSCPPSSCPPNSRP